MRTQLVLTLIGSDRPGLVEALSDEIARFGGNWEQSRMARLDDKFAGILRISIAQDRAAVLSQALGSLERQGLRIVVEASGVEASKAPAGQTFQLDVVGSDRPGIVRDIARALARRNVNVDELHTRCEDAPMGGGQVFRATALLHAPGELGVADLSHALEAIADDLMVEISEPVASR